MFGPYGNEHGGKSNDHSGGGDGVGEFWDRHRALGEVVVCGVCL